MEYIDFCSNNISRIIKGNWQLAGGHGQVNIQQSIEDLFEYVDAGITVFDTGDIYTGVEEILGAFLRRYRAIHGSTKLQKLRVHTKFVPDLDALEDLSKQDIRFIIERSIQRLGVDKLHLVQFHWWDFEKGDFIEAAKYLFDLRSEGLIEEIGVTNFDQKHLEMLLNQGLEIKSNQIQFSLLDPRPLNGMLKLAQKHDIAIFAYGVLAGGLLGSSNPVYDPTNRSHNKYKLIIDEVTHEYYDLILTKITNLSKKYNTTTGNIAISFVLETAGIDAAILGPRNLKHLEEIKQLDSFHLTHADYDELNALVRSRLETVTSDIYSYERDRSGQHGRIMKYNLNGMRLK